MSRRWTIVIVVLAVIGLLLAVNTITVSQETKPAQPGGGVIVSLPDGGINIREDGRRSAPPVVLIHGWTGSTNWWSAATPALARRYRVIRVDLLGHGRSAKPESGYTIDEQGTAVARAIAALGVRHALVAGHSTGGEVAISMAARFPVLVRKLVVLDTETDEDQVDTDLATKVSVVPVTGQLFWQLGTDGQIRKGLEQAFADGFDVPQAFVDDFREMTFTSYKKTYDDSADYVDDGTLVQDFKKSRMPAMVIFGSEDKVVDPAAAETYPKIRPARVEIVEGSGHSPMVEKPGQTAALMTAFDRAGNGR
jgi:pimeloyl-ACP methyl ester carboxylesterase